MGLPVSDEARSKRPGQAVASRLFAGTLVTLFLLQPQAALAQDDATCLGCHNDPDLEMTFDAEGLAHSVHADQACIDCHSDLEGMGDEHGDVKPVDCAGCHEDEATAHAGSEHGKKMANGKEAATCIDCHGPPHAMLSAGNTNSVTHFTKAPQHCAQCHGRPDVMADYKARRKETIVDYTNSVHGLALNQKGPHGAACTDCHGVHNIRRGTDPQSAMFWQRIPETCGACHEEITRSFQASVHGTAVAEGKRDAPVCTDCHGEHTIAAVSQAASFVAPSHIPETCGQCHGVERISTKYKLPGAVVDSYLQSYHGLAAQIGGVAAANCASCHGYHDVLPSSDPASSIHASNLPQTCGKCHPNIGTRLATENYRVHGRDEAEDPDRATVVRIITVVYIVAIVAIIGGMLVFNFLDFAAKVRAHMAKIAADPKSELRMTPGLKFQHGLLVVTFVLLAYTGFVHSYPDTFWGWPFREIADGSYWRGLIHRIAGWIFTALFAVHLFLLVATARGRQYMHQLALRRHDAFDAFRVLRRNLGLGGHPAPARTFNYAEKAEYWALVWGSVVMIITGVMLIFTSETLRLLPQVWLEVAQVVHFYEAVLATFAIVVWHFYWVIFDPNEYPMNTAWWTGLRRPPHADGKEEHKP
jgi:cytochrome b subunit of formate dehydrogenase/nitrate/TMAO reductase-like tetraheme cytochrome c subunit